MTKRFYGGLISATPPDTRPSSAGVITTTDQANLRSNGSVQNLIYVEYLIVAGGGGGGSAFHHSGCGGGGGAGGVVSGALYLTSDTVTYSITVGAGGNGAPAGTSGSGGYGGNGGSSSMIVGGTVPAITAVGGGGGTTYPVAVGLAGGSGGGAGGAGEGGVTLGGPQTLRQGFPGGSHTGSGQSTVTTACGGGGGAGGPGGNGVANGAGGNGGPGIQTNISGSILTLAGGGGGGSNRPGGSLGGSGIGGDGGINAAGGTNGSNAVVNTGSGGGGGAGGASNPASATGGNGSSGIVILRHSTFYGNAESTTANVSIVDNNVIYRFTQSGTITFTSSDRSGLQSNSLAFGLGTINNPALSALQIKSVNPSAADGIYFINLPTVGVTPIYCIMDSRVNGGGWMMAMKSTRGTTFNYSSDLWTTANTLNPSQNNRNDGDAKFHTMNHFQARDIMALWPDITTNGGGLGSNPFNCWSWLQNGFNGGTRSTLISFFNTAGTYNTGNVNTPNNYGGYFLELAKSSTSWANGVFSSQNSINFYGFNYKNGGLSWGGTARVRWGFAWNENGEGNYTSPATLAGGSATGSNDVSGGIGMDSGFGNYSAGDFVSCCQDSTGINRSARVEIYIR